MQTIQNFYFQKKQHRNSVRELLFWEKPIYIYRRVFEVSLIS